MRAVCIKNGKGSAEDLYIGTVDTPELTDTQLLVKVRCFGLNRMDISQRQGNYPPPPGASDILGVELSGVVEKAGSKVTRFKLGDAVFGLVPGGAYAEYVVLEKSLAMPKPEKMSFQEAAAIPETWFTAYQALFLVGGLEKDMNVLIHAGASGVGIAAIQLARFAGAKRIYVTVGSDAKIEFCKSIGADVGFNYKTENWAERLSAETNGKGVDLIIDFVAQQYFNDNLASLSLDGCLVLLSLLSGPMAPNVNMAPILRKRLAIRGSTLRSRTVEYQSRLRAEVFENVVIKHFCNESDHIKLFIDKEFNWNDITKAHQYLESNQSMGKVIVHVS